MVTIIYQLTFPSGKSYIGLTADLTQRMHDHASRGRSTWCHTALANAVRKYGMPGPEVLLVCEDADAPGYERMVIRSHGTLAPGGYNLTTGGEESKAQHPETRRKLSEKAKLRRNTCSDPEHRARISRALTGRKFSDETRRRMSEAAKRRIANETPEQRDARRVSLDKGRRCR